MINFLAIVGALALMILVGIILVYWKIDRDTWRHM